MVLEQPWLNRSRDDNRNRLNLFIQPQAMDWRVDRVVRIHVGTGQVDVNHRRFNAHQS